MFHVAGWAFDIFHFHRGMNKITYWLLITPRQGNLHSPGWSRKCPTANTLEKFDTPRVVNWFSDFIYSECLWYVRLFIVILYFGEFKMYSLNDWRIFRLFHLLVWCKLLAGSCFLFFPLPLGDTNTKGTLDSFLLEGGQCYHSLVLFDGSHPCWYPMSWQVTEWHCCRIYGSVDPRVCTYPYVLV